jgi:hypothetical protein
LQGEDKQRFLDAIDWNYLKTHLQAVAEGNNTMSALLANAIADLGSSALTLLRIDDSGTEGLTGDEDTPGTNVSSLCRNILDTTKDAPGKGGSYGLGKALLWHSQHSPPCYSRRELKKRPRKSSGFLPARNFHHMKSSYRAGTDRAGYGFPETVRNGKRAISMWDEEAEKITRAIHLYRPAQLGTGTSF